jgi:hypothetical protein
MQEPNVPGQDPVQKQTEVLTSALVPGGALVTGAANAVSQTLPLVEKLDKSVALISQKMGDGMRLSQSIKENLSKGAESVISIGGVFENATALQSDFLDVFGKNITLQSETYDELFATQQVSGVAAKTLMESFADAGFATKNITKEMRSVVEIAQSLGVNASAVSSKVTQNLDKLNRFGFQGGIDGLAKMAAQSAVLRTNMDQVFNIAEDLMSPEKAIEMSSALQRLGATTTSLVDPLKLMDLAQNDVGELQNQLGQLFKQYTTFDEKSQKFEIMPSARRDLKAIAQELGMSVDEVTKFAIGTADVEKKLSEISFQGLDVDEDTQKMIANMATMGKGGEYEITTKDEGTVSLQDFLKKYQGKEDELKKYFESEAAAAAETPEDKMIAQAKEQLGALGQISATLNTMNTTIGLAVGGTQAGQEILKLAQKNIEIQTKDFIENFGAANKNFTDGLNALASNLKKANEEGDFSLALTSFKDFGKIILDQAVATTQGVLSGYGEAVGMNLDIDINSIKEKIEGAISSFTTGVSSVATTLTTIKDTLTSAFSGLGDIVGTIKSKIGMEDGEIDIGGGTNIVTYSEGVIQPIETEIGDKIMVYKNETKPEKEYLTEQISQVENKATPNQNTGNQINNTLTQIANNVNSSLSSINQNAQQNTMTTNNNNFETLNEMVQKMAEQKEPTFNVVIPKSIEGEQSQNVSETKNETIFLQNQLKSFSDIKLNEKTTETNLNKINEVFLKQTELLKPEQIKPTAILEQKELKTENTEETIKSLMSQTNTRNENIVSGGEPIRVTMDYNVKIDGNGINTLTAQQLEPILNKMLKENNNTQQAVMRAIENADFGLKT